MRRVLAVLVLGCMVAASQGAGPPRTERARLEKQAAALNQQMNLLYQQGKVADAAAVAISELHVAQQLYPQNEYPEGHSNLAVRYSNLGVLLSSLGDPTKALDYHHQALAMRRTLYPKDRFPNGHPDLVVNLNNLGSTRKSQGEPAQALRYFEQALAMSQRLYPKDRFKAGHPLLARSLHNLGFGLAMVGEKTKALGYYEQALAMRQRLYPEILFPNGHLDLAESLNSLGGVLLELEESGKAFGYLEQGLAMFQVQYPTDRFPNGHPYLAACLTNLGFASHNLGKPTKALGYFEQALVMRRTLYPGNRFKDGHPDLARSMVALANALQVLGEPAKARGHHEQALAMRQKLFPADRFKSGHPELAASLHGLGVVLMELGENAKAVGFIEQGYAMSGRISAREMLSSSEAQAQAYLRAQAVSPSHLLSAATTMPDRWPHTYATLWPHRVGLLQMLFRRQETARIAQLRSASARTTWEDLCRAHRQVSRLLFEPGMDPVARDQALAHWQAEQERLEREVAKYLPQLEAHERLARLGPKDLAANLPARSAFIDIVRYQHHVKTWPTGDRYLAFVLTPDAKVQGVQLGEAKAIDDAIASWRRAIAAREASNAPPLLRTLVWEPIDTALPKGTRTVYLCPEGDLAKLPFAALPGATAGTVLLEDYTLATVPAGAWLLQQLAARPADDTNPLLLAVGDIDFGGPKPYEPLPETKRELDRVTAGTKFVALRGKDATVAAVRARLPEATVAHLATHAYFDQPALDAEYQRVLKQREAWRPGGTPTAPAGAAARLPLGFVGLVLAGGNAPATADGGGVLTGLDVLALPLPKLRLCVLSGCETGRGRWDEGNGVAGLQRAFHVAGCRDVVGSLWQVNDAATAALMAEFYRELRVNKKPPLEALRQAQLTIYKNPERIPTLAGPRGKPDSEKATKLGSEKEPPAEKGARADTKLWAAFVLSGPGD